ncbi:MULTISPECIES: phosphoenolpyruvate--protein phosphotransferase [Ferrimonas]|uniref:phosphoenolpyruvate--protein phosphotransferase n=1 Tax=Ferrimonas TaxID=44011 RepID=UPI00041F1AC7|nr:MULTISPECIES: phosphoenolpyruvate--protein phosphotransferase [Ferrimonas]USD35968.1 phosphoenolpyruvate--protein phosphotransferase [Ferrimonas sp. SCSIO 43195]
MSQTIVAQVLSTGLIRGSSYRCHRRITPVDHSRVDENEVAGEIAHIHQALQAEVAALDALLSQALSDDERQLMEADRLMLMDDELAQDMCHHVELHHCNAASAIERVLSPMVDEISAIEDANLCKRGVELAQLKQRLIQHALGHRCPLPTSLNEKQVLVVDYLSPAEFLRYPDIAGLVVSQATYQDHLAILARGMQIPLMVVTPEQLAGLPHHQEILLDGEQGTVTINPSRVQSEAFEVRFEQWQERQQAIEADALSAATDADGNEFSIGANVSTLAELPQVARYGCREIGLLRTELLFMDRLSLPNAQEQYQTYRTIAEAIAPHSMTIRLFDFGADKMLDEMPDEANPALGHRGIRLGLEQPQLLLPQLKAIARLSQEFEIKMLVPMVNQVEELQQLSELYQQAAADLPLGPHSRQPQLGVMVETPAAVMNIDAMAPLLDFISIGTNDLTQYLYAADRNDPTLSKWYRPVSPAMIRALAYCCSRAKTHGLNITLCGEMASDPKALPLLLAMGIDGLSLVPTQRPLIKSVLARLKVSQCQQLLDRALKTQTTRELGSILNSL